ncbi:MAG TPA: hypothetical protein VLI54_03725 [Bacillota bacterium]|nr:hypothetical protein [Bacillota bacterium]
MIVSGRYGLGYPAEGIDLPGVDPVAMSVYEHAGSMELILARTQMVAAYYGKDAEVTDARKLYIPLVSGMVADVYAEVQAGAPDDPLVANLAVRSIAEALTFERGRRLSAADSYYHHVTGARRALTLMHYRRGPVATLAEQEGLRIKSAGRIAAHELSMVKDMADTLVKQELRMSRPLAMAGIANIAAQHVVGQQVSGERSLLVRTIDDERRRR